MIEPLEPVASVRPIGDHARQGDEMRFPWVETWAEAIDAWTDWMTIAGKRPGTIELRRYQIRRLASGFIRRSPWRITTGELVTWLAAQPWQPATRDSQRTALRTFYAWAVTTKRTRSNPAAALPAIRSPRPKPRPTPDDVWERAWAAADDRDRLILALGGHAGLRRSEIAGLRWEHDLGDHLRITGKGGHTRLIPVHGELRRLLDDEHKRRRDGGYGDGWRYRPDDDAGWVFPGRGNRGSMTPDAVRKAVLRRFGGGWSTHSMRHRFGTRAYAGTRDLGAVQDVMGHASPRTTRIYTEVSNAALRAAVEST